MWGCIEPSDLREPIRLCPWQRKTKLRHAMQGATKDTEGFAEPTCFRLGTPDVKGHQVLLLATTYACCCHFYSSSYYSYSCCCYYYSAAGAAAAAAVWSYERTRYRHTRGHEMRRRRILSGFSPVLHATNADAVQFMLGLARLGKPHGVLTRSDKLHKQHPVMFQSCRQSVVLHG